MKHLLLVLVGLLLGVASVLSQITGFTVERYAVHSTDAVGLQGYTTYHIYVETTGEDIFIESVFASDGNGELPATNPLSLEATSGQLFVTPVASTPGPVILTIGSSDYHYSTMISIGTSFLHNAQFYNTQLDFDYPSEIMNGFLSGEGFSADEFSCSTPINKDNGWVGASNRKAIARITSNGTWEFCFSIKGYSAEILSDFYALNVCLNSEMAVNVPSEAFDVVLSNHGKKCTENSVLSIGQSPEIQPLYDFKTVVFLNHDYKLFYSETEDGEFAEIDQANQLSDFALQDVGFYYVTVSIPETGFEAVSGIKEVFLGECSPPGGDPTNTFQGVSVEIHAIHDGEEIPELAGYITYQVYAELNPGDFVSLMFGNPDPNNAVGSSTNPLKFELLSGSLFQDPVGSFLPVNCALSMVSPAVAYDSWLTIGMDCSSPGDNTFLAYILDNPGPVFISDFESGNSAELTSGGIYTLQEFSNGWADEEGKVLLAQFTTNGEWEFCFSLQGQVQGSPGLANTWGAINVCASSNDAPLPPSGMQLEADNQMTCAGGEAIIYLEQMEWFVPQIAPEFKLLYAPDENVNFQVIDAAVGVSSFTVNQPGLYKLYLESSMFAYSDMSNTIVITAPADFEANASTTLTNPCLSSDFDLSVEVMGGTAPFLFGLDGVVYQESPVFSGLPCGDWTLFVIDANDCMAELTGFVECFQLLSASVASTDETEQGLSDGTATLEIEAGTGGTSISGNVNGPGFNQSFEGASPYSLELTELAPGSYQVTYSDGDCSGTIDFFIAAGPVHVADLPSIAQIHVYPNPFRSWFQIEVPEQGILILYDAMGREVYTERLNSGRNTIEMSGITSGMYSCVYQTENVRVSVPVIKTED